MAPEIEFAQGIFCRPYLKCVNFNKNTLNYRNFDTNNFPLDLEVTLYDTVKNGAVMESL